MESWSSGTAFENEEVLKPYSMAALVSTCFWSFMAPPAAVLTLLFKAQAGLCLLPCLCLYYIPSYPLLVAASSGTAPHHSSVFLEGLQSTESQPPGPYGLEAPNNSWNSSFQECLNWHPEELLPVFLDGNINLCWCCGPIMGHRKRQAWDVKQASGL